jgi:bacteriocin-like protein
MQELNDKQLEQVTGGTSSFSSSRTFPHSNSAGNSASTGVTAGGSAQGEHAAGVLSQAHSFAMPGPDGSTYSFSWGAAGAVAG